MFWRAQWPDPVLPGMDLGLPGLNPWLPGVDLGLPGVDPGLAGVDPGLAGVDPGLPGSPRILGTRPGMLIRRVLGCGGEEPGGEEQPSRQGSQSSRTVGQSSHCFRIAEKRKTISHSRGAPGKQGPADMWMKRKTSNTKSLRCVLTVDDGANSIPIPATCWKH